jgi:hypothetical protein
MEFTLGAFMREGGQFAGIYASPDGPVFFMNDERLPLRFGDALATTVKRGDAPFRRFTLTATDEAGRERTFSMEYREREGIGTNPYDAEIEDVDMLAMIARGVRSREFFEVYTLG